MLCQAAAALLCCLMGSQSQWLFKDWTHKHTWWWSQRHSESDNQCCQGLLGIVAHRQSLSTVAQGTDTNKSSVFINLALQTEGELFGTEYTIKQEGFTVILHKRVNATSLMQRGIKHIRTMLNHQNCTNNIGALFKVQPEPLWFKAINIKTCTNVHRSSTIGFKWELLL